MNYIVAAAIGGMCLLPLAQSYRRGRVAQRFARWQGQPELENWPRASVIIPAWCERGTLEACIANVQRVDYPDYEVIVVAGGSDGTYEAAEKFSQRDGRIRVIRQRDAGGKNGAMNDAVRLSTGGILVFLDADGLVAAGWLKALVAALGGSPSGPSYAASTGRYIPIQRSVIARAGEMSQVLEYEARGRVSLQGSGSMALRRAAWDAIGELPEGPYADDWDLNARLRHARMTVSHARGAIVWTERPRNLRQWWENELRWRRIHLASLFRIARAEMPDSLASIRALYPYIIGWYFMTLGAAVLMRRLLPGRSRLLEPAWLAVTGPAVAREVAGAVETAAYTGDLKWFSVAAVIPALTVLSWIAAVIASLSKNRAPLHFKGPREWTARVASVAGETRRASGDCSSVTQASTRMAA